ncbi:transporter, major facilitator family protein [Besnoitia besnoiti]|uniref:Transporter, major facilitator family protein n=1 Tax=Besnoitia besnoiti TaxID=94643 RepID=A0A2A9M8F5_BESBE|nr:transporter, major facilitator family protein [Besnoitia besnoiti]PFH34758.1 transporter, major facilitator family protein [Besnoitia besnoiti]
MASKFRAPEVTQASVEAVSEAPFVDGGPPGSWRDHLCLRVKRPQQGLKSSPGRSSSFSKPDDVHTHRTETEFLSQRFTSASVTSPRPGHGGSRDWPPAVREYLDESDAGPGSTGVPSPKIAFGLSRWAVLLLYCVYCVFSGPAYINWTPIADVLFKAGAYEWRCQGAVTSPDLPLVGDGMAKCEDQEADVNRLFTITAASHFFFSFIGGSLLDTIGPKATAIVGLISSMTGWVLLGLANEHLLTYIPGCLFMGAGLDTTYFPLLSGANLFPGHVATVKAVFGAALSFSFLVPVAVRAVSFESGGAVHHRLIFCCFGGICLGFSLLIALLVIPQRPWRAPYRPFGQQLRDQPLAGGCGVATQSGQRLPCAGVESEEQVPSEGGEESQLPERVCCAAVAVPHPSCEEGSPVPPSSSRFPPIAIVGGAHGGSKALRIEGQAGASNSRTRTGGRRWSILSRLSPVRSGARQPPCNLPEKLLQHLRTMQRDFWSTLFLPIVPFFCVALTSVVFFIPSARHLMPDAYTANRIIQIFSFIPCPLFGYIADIWGIMPVMYICNLCGLLSFILAMVPAIPAAAPLQFAASILSASQLSFLVCQICCYVAETFDEENQGKLIGLLCSVAGLTSLSAHPIMDYSVRSGFRPALLSFIVCFCSNFLLLLFVHWRKVKTGRILVKESKKKCPPRQQNPETADSAEPGQPA